MQGLNLVGILGILVGGPKSDRLFDYPDDVAEKILSPYWIIYKIGILLILVLIITQRFFPDVIRWLRGTQKHSPKAERTAGMLLPGVCASFTFVYFKVLMEMTSTEKGGSPVGQWSFWCVVALIAPFAAGQLWSLNLSLSMYDASKAIPLYASTLIVLGSCNGLILFEEYGNIGALYKWVFFLLGIFVAVSSITLAGMFTTERGDVARESEDVNVTKPEHVEISFEKPECRPVQCEAPEIPEQQRGAAISIDGQDGRGCCEPGTIRLFGFPAVCRG